MVASTEKLVNAASLVRSLVCSEQVARLFRFVEDRAAQTTQTQIELCEIPAPPFNEATRAVRLCEMFRATNLQDVCIDAEGNALGFRQGSSPRPLLVVSAHLDTVFPAGTDCTVRFDESHPAKLYAPGISDDAAGLAAMVTIARAFDECRIETESSILFVGTVGEEGAGDLRGARHLLTEGAWKDRVDAFISLDGPGLERITNAALGSRRYRVRFAGAGGHSWGDFGVANPVHALGRAVARLTSYPTPIDPRTSFNVGRIEGGASVNVIAREATMDVDLRSESEDEMQRLDSFFRRAVREAAAEENRQRRAGTQALQFEIETIGNRPGGSTAPGNPLVQIAVEATAALGFNPRLDLASTDSNIAISLGIPALTLGAGGTSGNAHTLDEWFDTTNREAGLKRALLVALAFVGVKD